MINEPLLLQHHYWYLQALLLEVGILAFNRGFPSLMFSPEGVLDGTQIVVCSVLVGLLGKAQNELPEMSLFSPAHLLRNSGDRTEWWLSRITTKKSTPCQRCALSGSRSGATLSFTSAMHGVWLDCRDSAIPMAEAENWS